MYLYKYGVECDYFTIILDGKAVLQVGKEGMEVDAGLFSYYGVGALMEESEQETDPIKVLTTPIKAYKPEFSLKVNSYCVYLQITRKDWKDAVKQSIIERNAGVAAGSSSLLNVEPLSSMINSTVSLGPGVGSRRMAEKDTRSSECETLIARKS